MVQNEVGKLASGGRGEVSRPFERRLTRLPLRSASDAQNELLPLLFLLALSSSSASFLCPCLLLLPLWCLDGAASPDVVRWCCGGCASVLLLPPDG